MLRDKSRACSAPRSDGAPQPRRSQALTNRFGPQFDDYLQAMYAHALQQARDFVEFVAPGPRVRW